MNTLEMDQAKPLSTLTKATFFRQSGWMAFATFIGGIFFYAVHFFAARSRMPQDEYGAFTTLLQVLNQMAIPAVGLQTIFVQQAALTESEEHRRELAGAFRSVLKATFFIWLAAAALVLVFQQRILPDYKIRNPAALWAVVGAGLFSLWNPVMGGMMMGRQNFLWLGWSTMLSALARLALVAFIVWVLAGQAAGAMCGVFLSMTVTFGIGIWQTQHLWRGETAPFVWTPWLKQVLPLTLGMGATTFMFTLDMIAVRRFLPESGIYGAAGMIGRALMFLVAPMTMVMFPKIVQSAAKSERTDVLAQALGATALLAGSAALFCTFFAEVPLTIVQGQKYLAAAPLVPWFTWCMLPLTVSNVLVSNLLARQRYAVVPWLVTLACGYGLTLWQEPVHTSHLRVIQTLGVFASLYFLVCLWFTWGKNVFLPGARGR
jgi:O-antigen/teichoic acid export membrane protein